MLTATLIAVGILSHANCYTIDRGFALMPYVLTKNEKKQVTKTFILKLFWMKEFVKSNPYTVKTLHYVSKHITWGSGKPTSCVVCV